MNEDKKDFIKFMIESEVLRFGDFTLKSGRKAPYFVNTGKYRTGGQISRLGEYYAEAYLEHKVSAKTLIGPAYKGIPLAVSTSIALARKGVDTGFCFDRKEVKDHGEGGCIVGKQLGDGERVAIIEDVMTSGKALREVMPKLKETANVDVAAMIIQVDRMEKGLNGDKSAVQEVSGEFGVNIYPIVNMNDIIEAIEDGVVPGREYLEKMIEYRKVYGV